MAGRQINEGSLEDATALDDMVGHFLHEISARHSTDEEDCLIVGSVLLPRGRLAVVDKINKCVKLFDLEARKLTGKVSFSLEPQDITAIGEDRLAVVFGNPIDYQHYLDKNKQRQDDENKQLQYKNKEVQFLQQLRVKPKLTRSITLPLPGRAYRGVTCQGEKLYLTCVDPRSIQIFNLDGTLLKQINNENIEGGWLFAVPSSIAVSPDGAHIYVRDLINVVCLTTEGQEVWTFNPSGLLFGGMDVDKQGRLFVCNEDDPPIHILSSAGRPGTLLLDKEVGDSWTVAVGDGRMYLGGVGDEISVFGLEAVDSARQDLPPPVDQSMDLSGHISLRDNTRDRESYRLTDNNKYDSPSENQSLELPSHILVRDTNRDRDSCRLPGSNRPDVLLEDIEEEPPVKIPKFE